MNSCLPERNSISPESLSFSRYSISIYSSAGTAMNEMEPFSFARTAGLESPTAAASMFPIWMLWPHTWAAPVFASATRCSGTISESSSPIIAMCGPGRPVSNFAMTPVIATFSRVSRPVSFMYSAVFFAVRRSRKPDSG